MSKIIITLEDVNDGVFFQISELAIDPLAMTPAEMVAFALAVAAQDVMHSMGGTTTPLGTLQ